MSESAQSEYTVAENLRWFAVVYLVALILFGFLLNLLRNAGVDIPQTGVGIGIYAGAVLAAGSRFAGRRGDWISRDRHNLALGYLTIAIPVSCALFALTLLISPSPSLVVASGWSSMIGILIAIVLGVALLYYGMARLMLKIIARRGGQQ